MNNDTQVLVATNFDSTIRTWANAATPSWALEPIRPWNETESDRLQRFLCEDHWCNNESINVFSVVGSRNSSYYDWSWLKLINEGKRMGVNLPLHATNPIYYHNDEIKLPTMSFITYDGMSLYVDADGNHRTCIAKFDFARSGKTRLNGVTVRRLKVDAQALALHQEINTAMEKRNLGHCEPLKVTIGREDSAGWKTDRYRIDFMLTEFSKKKVQLTQEQARTWLSQRQKKSWLGRLFTR
jgi:hypothetical protein